MNIGLKRGAQGAGVERLHRVLASFGIAVDEGEVERREFGPSTTTALRAIQGRRGLPQTDEIDVATLQVLLEIEQNVTDDLETGEFQTIS